MTEQINLQGDNYLNEYVAKNDELSDDEETNHENRKESKTGDIVIVSPPVKGPEFEEKLLNFKEYKRLFANECEAIIIKDESKITYDELCFKLEECKVCVANRSNNSMHRHGFKTMLSVAEIHLAPKIGMDLSGFTHTAMNDDDLIKTLDEMALMQSWTTKFIPPEQRLLFGLGTIALRINAANKAAKKELKVPENQGNYDDL